jgi:hypothetical protein
MASEPSNVHMGLLPAQSIAETATWLSGKNYGRRLRPRLAPCRSDDLLARLSERLEVHRCEFKSERWIGTIVVLVNLSQSPHEGALVDFRNRPARGIEGAVRLQFVTSLSHGSWNFDLSDPCPALLDEMEICLDGMS